MGVVWAATNTQTGMPVALKLLKERSSPETTSKKISADARSRQRFLREARAACAVRHPNVVHIYDIVELDDVPMMVMSSCPASLANRLHLGRARLRERPRSGAVV